MLPDAADFAVDGATSEAETVVRKPSGDSDGYMIQAFDGPVTKAAFERFGSSGRVQIRLQMTPGDSSLWVIDISGYAKARAAWENCLSKIRMPASGELDDEPAKHS